MTNIPSFTHIFVFCCFSFKFVLCFYFIEDKSSLTFYNSPLFQVIAALYDLVHILGHHRLDFHVKDLFVVASNRIFSVLPFLRLL